MGCSVHLPCDALVSRALARIGGISEGGVNVVRRELGVRERSSAYRLRSGCYELGTPCTPCKCAITLLRHVPPWDLHIGSAVHFARASNRCKSVRGRRRKPRVPIARMHGSPTSTHFLHEDFPRTPMSTLIAVSPSFCMAYILRTML